MNGDGQNSGALVTCYLQAHLHDVNALFGCKIMADKTNKDAVVSDLMQDVNEQESDKGASNNIPAGD